MKSRRRSSGVLVLLLLFLISHTGFGQTPGSIGGDPAGERPRVLLLPFESLTNRAQDATVARTTTETALLTLRLLDRYELVPPAGLTSAGAIGLNAADLDELAGEQRADNIIFGTVTLDGTGALLFSLSVFDRAEARVTVQAQSRAPSIFDVFDAADELVMDAVSGFSGVRIAFGSLRITPEEAEDYLLYLDGTLMGENVSLIERVLAGERLLEVRQRRGGQEFPVYRESVIVEEGRTRSVLFTFPVVTEEERRREEELRDQINRELAHGTDPGGAEQLILELQELYIRVNRAFPGGEEQIPYYRDRVQLAREMQDLVRVDIRTLAAERSLENLRAFDAIREPWLELVTRYREEEAAAPRDTADQETAGQTTPTATTPAATTPVATGLAPHIVPPSRRLELIRGDTQRNLTVLAALATLERAAVVDEREATLVDGYNQQMLSLQSLLASSTRPYELWMEERVRAQTEMRRYTLADQRRRPAWHWVAGTLGMGALGYAGYVQFSGVLEDLDSEVTTLIDQYESETELDLITSRRSELDDRIREKDTLEVTRTIAAGAGIALVGTAVVARLISRSRPARIWNQYRDHPFPDRWTAAGLDYRTRSLDRSDPPTLLVLGSDETFVLNGQVLTTPQMIPAGEAGSPAWEIQHRTARAGVQDRYRVLLGEGGVQILYLGVAQ